MEIGFINSLLNIIERSNLSELEYTENGTRVRLVKGSARTGAPPAQGASPGARPASATTECEPVDRKAVAAQMRSHSITAPLAGLFYRAPATNQPPFVQVGDIVKEGQTLAIIEAMKILNSIEADIAGKVTEILVENGAEVAAGSPLFVIEPREGTDV